MPLKRLSILAASAYAGYALLIFLLQRQIIYPGRNLKPGGQPPAGIEPLEIHIAAGRCEAWFMPPLKRDEGERHPLLIYFHGNGELIEYLTECADGFRALGMGVLLVEYPGYGRSAGSPSEKSITEAAVAAFDTVIGRAEVDPQQIVIFGTSLGSGAACALAARRPSAALILQSPFTSIRPFSRNYLLPGIIVLDQFDNAKVLAGYDKPVLLFHGTRDTTVPPQHSRELARIAPQARLVELDCGHNDFPPDWHEFYLYIAVFLMEAGIIRNHQAPANGNSTANDR